MSRGARRAGHDLRIMVILLSAMAALPGCGTVAPRVAGIAREQPADAAKPAASARPVTRGGGYYQDDGPGDNPPPDIDAIVEPEPRAEPLHRFANNPYSVFGREYVPQRQPTPWRERGTGSWYGRKFHGQRTSSGEPYDMYAMSAAHPLLPIPSYARVTNLANGRSVIVRINDRGPFRAERIIDLSYTAAYKLGYATAGSATLEVEAILPAQIPLIASASSRREAPAPSGAAPARTEPVAEIRQVRIDDPPEARPVAPEPSRAQVAIEPLKEAPKQAAAIPVATDASGVYLQLGAFSAQENAESFRARIYRSLAWLEQAIQIQPKNGLFRVHLGPYRDRVEAAGMAERIRSALDLRAVVVIR